MRTIKQTPALASKTKAGISLKEIVDSKGDSTREKRIRQLDREMNKLEEYLISCRINGLSPNPIKAFRYAKKYESWMKLMNKKVYGENSDV